MAQVIEYVKLTNLHMYKLYADDYCAMIDEQITEHWGEDKHKVKKAIKKRYRQHTPRLCKKRLKKYRHSHITPMPYGRVK